MGYHIETIEPDCHIVRWKDRDGTSGYSHHNTLAEAWDAISARSQSQAEGEGSTGLVVSAAPHPDVRLRGTRRCRR